MRLLQQIGLEEAIQFARKIGIRSDIAPYFSLALGSSDVSLLELASAYAVFANHGVRLGPVSISLITDNTGRPLYANDALPVQVIKPETAFLVTNLMKGVIENGEVKEIQGGREAAKLQESLRYADLNGKNDWGHRMIGEVGIGLNPNARVCGAMIIDEKVKGTAHVALGSTGSMYVQSASFDAYEVPDQPSVPVPRQIGLFLLARLTCSCAVNVPPPEWVAKFAAPFSCSVTS